MSAKNLRKLLGLVAALLFCTQVLAAPFLVCVEMQTAPATTLTMPDHSCDGMMMANSDSTTMQSDSPANHQQYSATDCEFICHLYLSTILIELTDAPELQHPALLTLVTNSASLPLAEAPLDTHFRPPTTA